MRLPLPVVALPDGGLIAVTVAVIMAIGVRMLAGVLFTQPLTTS